MLSQNLNIPSKFCLPQWTAFRVCLHCLLCDHSVLHTTFNRPLIAYYVHRCRGPMTVIVMSKNASLMPLSTLEFHKRRTKRGTIERRLTSCEPTGQHRLIWLISVPLFPSKSNKCSRLIPTDLFLNYHKVYHVRYMKILGFLIIIVIILTDC